MDHPNSYTLCEDGDTWGIHEFRDGATYLCKQYASGDWFTVRPATAYEVNYMQDNGVKTEKSKGRKLL